MLTDNDIQEMYGLSYCLYPDNGLALSVTLEACERLTLMRKVHDRRTGYCSWRFPEAWLPQYCVYLASDAQERAQECPWQGWAARYRPNLDDYLVRYIKFLVWQTMDRHACHVAVALGCFLYRYEPDDIVTLAPKRFNSHTIRRVKQWLTHRIHARFQHAHIMRDEHHALCTRPPTEHERQVVHHALAMFTPWGSRQISTPSPDQSILETYFGEASPRSDWDRIHALIDPMGAGLSRLIGEYNESFPAQSALRLEAPDRKLEIPCFDL